MVSGLQQMPLWRQSGRTTMAEYWKIIMVNLCPLIIKRGHASPPPPPPPLRLKPYLGFWTSCTLPWRNRACTFMGMVDNLQYKINQNLDEPAWRALADLGERAGKCTPFKLLVFPFIHVPSYCTRAPPPPPPPRFAHVPLWPGHVSPYSCPLHPFRPCFPFFKSTDLHLLTRYHNLLLNMTTEKLVGDGTFIFQH